MPQMLEHIDAIGRRLKRDVLFLAFEPAAGRPSDYDKLEVRKHILQWLDSEGIAWCPCGDYARENVLRSYAGQVFVDVPFDEQDGRYRKLQSFLEFPDGKMRFEKVKFYVVTLGAALKNAHHDEPGFWDKWAENF